MIKKKPCPDSGRVTAYADTKTLQKAFSSDPVMYVVKPYRDSQRQLTGREKEIALLVAQDMSSKQIARKLAISQGTVLNGA